MPVVWRPIYSVHTAKGVISAEIPELETDECPRSLLERHPQSQELVNIILNAENLKRASGSHPFGPSRRWDAVFCDAVQIVNNERTSARNEVLKARNQS